MASINSMLMAFILIGFASFKLLFLQGATIPSDECDIGTLNLANCFIGISTSCEDIEFIDDNGDVCLDFDRFIDTLDINNSDCAGLFDVGACIEYLANVIFAIVQIIISGVLVIASLIINIVLVVAIYLGIGLTPLPDAPAVINLMFIGPFILGNLILVLSFFKGD